mmetsp:Transcript_169/g.438  ORF Transcript_169/g.438 Transcript_169/m.438 type:complete len:109 (-) Transcript_169:370-696(-)
MLANTSFVLSGNVSRQFNSTVLSQYRIGIQMFYSPYFAHEARYSSHSFHANSHSSRSRPSTSSAERAAERPPELPPPPPAASRSASAVSSPRCPTPSSAHPPLYFQAF